MRHVPKIQDGRKDVIQSTSHRDVPMFVCVFTPHMSSDNMVFPRPLLGASKDAINAVNHVISPVFLPIFLSCLAISLSGL